MQKCTFYIGKLNLHLIIFDPSVWSFSMHPPMWPQDLGRNVRGGFSKYWFSNVQHIQVVPGRAGGGSFRRKKNYIAKKEFAYRRCARRPTSAMPKPLQTISLLGTSLLLFHGGDVTCFDACHVIWCGGHVIWCDVIACVMSCHVMQCDVMWCALMWCALQWSRCVFEVVLWRCGDPKYHSVLQSSTVYYKVLLQYYSSTTLYYSSTTSY